ncbi:phage tail sheath subtilisin-like domain-containing protein [Eikenella corrodens]|uniref:phage tail sheath subtilisin-like domain-containing protein n=1 Tax=Eikenella corrodens TaxID=539 RepID=UPI000B4D7FA9|nr:phage tail sheath subtilisin-like domain-containing protein [Eikenella corrodens]OWP26885.1 phage tail protein [Eikenella corrodens]
MTASRHHGITANEFTHGVRAIADISTAIIGMVCTADDADNAAFPLNTPIFHTSAYNVLGKAGEKGTLAKSLDAIVDQADAQIVIVRVPESDNADTLKANVIGSATGGNYTGLKALRRAKAITGQTPKILGVPEMDSQDVVTELVGLAQATRAFVYASAGGAENISEVTSYRQNFGQRELMLIDNDFLAFDTAAKANKPAATIARVLGARAKLDTQIGWHKSISNTEINGVSALKYGRTFALLDKNCDANTLNNADVTTLIRENGFRVWGNRTCSSDPMLAFEVAVRSAQIIQETIASAFLWAMDKPMHPSLIEDIIMGINAKLAEYVNKGYILGARVFLDKGKVTPQAIQAGQFAFDYEWTYVPPLENMVFNQHNTDTFFVNLVDKVISFASNLKATTI